MAGFLNWAKNIGLGVLNGIAKFAVFIILLFVVLLIVGLFTGDGMPKNIVLAMDLRDSGRDAWDVACAMAGRGFTLDAASHRVIVVRLTETDIAEGVHHRLAPALLLALWSTPAQASEAR